MPAMLGTGLAVCRLHAIKPQQAQAETDQPFHGGKCNLERNAAILQGRDVHLIQSLG